jgi:DNA-binding XRE family transcriptional regulator
MRYLRLATMTAHQMTEARKRLGLTQAQLAEALGVTRRAVVYWEAGRRSIARPVEMAVESLLQQHRQHLPPRKRGGAR